MPECPCRHALIGAKLAVIELIDATAGGLKSRGASPVASSVRETQIIDVDSPPELEGIPAIEWGTSGASSG